MPNVGGFSELRVAVFIGGACCGKGDPHECFLGLV